MNTAITFTASEETENIVDIQKAQGTLVAALEAYLARDTEGPWFPEVFALLATIEPGSPLFLQLEEQSRNTASPVDLPWWPKNTWVRPDMRVCTMAVENPPADWTAEAVARRRFGVTGVVVQHHDSHGLCFDVRHDDDDTVGCYEERELNRL